MPISFDCACGRKIRTADENAGRSASCPACGVTVLVPGSDAGRPWRDAPAKEEGAPAGNGFGYNLQSEEVVPTARPSAPPAPYDRPRSDDPRRSARPPLDDRFVKRTPTRSGGRTDKGAVAGVLMMVGAVVWFVVGMAVGIIFFYPPILFIIGLICFIKGLANRN